MPKFAVIGPIDGGGMNPDQNFARARDGFGDLTRRDGP